VCRCELSSLPCVPVTFFLRPLFVSDPISSMLYLFLSGILPKVRQWNDAVERILGAQEEAFDHRVDQVEKMVTDLSRTRRGSR
jgi:hypothetical protein